MMTIDEARAYGREYAQQELDALVVESLPRDDRYNPEPVREGLRVAGLLDDIDPACGEYTDAVESLRAEMRDRLLDAAADAAETEWSQRLPGLRNELAAERDGYEWPGGSAPAWSEFTELDEADLLLEIADLEEQVAAATCGPFPNSLVIENGTREIALCEQSLVALRAGKRVRWACDEDGFWFAHGVE